MRLKGKSTIVTGGSSGIGRAIALKFANEGARVAILDIRKESKLEKESPSTIEIINNKGGKGDFYKVDLCNKEEVESALQSILKSYQDIDILVNNAGIFIRNSITEVSDDEWEKVINTNLRSYFYTTRKIIPHMVENRSGKIINMSSIHGILGTGSALTYCTTKGAINNFTKQLAVDYSEYGININAINPGTIKTAMSKPFRETPEILKEYKESTLLPRLGETEDVADAALFLASEESDFITGHCLVVDGGWTAR